MANPRSTRHAELASFLQERRAMLQPSDIGLPCRGRRRVPGLRREEVARLAGVSISWYTCLEQGRDIRMSESTLDAIARTLQLSDHEWRYFRFLVGAPLLEATLPADREISHNLSSFLETLMPDAGMVTTATFDLLAWNRSAALLYGDAERYPREQRNLLWMFFMAPEIRERFENWEVHAQEAVARFRSRIAWFTGTRFEALITELKQSPEFRQMWRRHNVNYADFATETHHIRHPLVGRISTQTLYFRSLDQMDVILVINRAVDDQSRDRLRRLLELTDSAAADEPSFAQPAQRRASH